MAWVFKGVEDGRRPLALSEGHPINGYMAISGVACPRGGVEGLGMAGPVENSDSPSIRPSVRPFFHPSSHEKLLTVLKKDPEILQDVVFNF
jgi:hypothetical protein